MRYLAVQGARLSVIGLGTWQFGSKDWGYGTDYAREEAVRIVHRALDLGVDVIDTAEVYGRGESERIVGRAIAGRRDDVFLATKVLPTHPVGGVVERHGRASLERLGVDHLDLYQLHWPNPVVPVGEQMRGMRRLRDAGLVRHVGVSNYSLSRWRAAERAFGGPVLSDQVQFNLAHAGPSRDLVPYAAANDRLVVAYSPLAKGLLSGRYDVDHLPRDRARATDPLFLPDNVVAARPLIQTVARVASAHDALPAQVALAWVVSHPNVLAIPGASSVEQLEVNCAAADLELDAEELRELTDAAAAFRPQRGAVAWGKVATRFVRR